MKKTFIHTSDIHLGMKFNNRNFSLKEREKRREELWSTFDEIINKSRIEDIDYLFIAGDMTQGEYLNFKNLGRIVKKLGTAQKTKIIITCGKNDPININSMYEYIEWPQNVYLVRSTDSVQKISFEEDNLCVYSISCDKSQGYDNSQLIYDISTDENKINVLLLYCDTEKLYPDTMYINPDLIKNKFDYCALGGNHNFTVVNNNIVYPGTPEPTSFDEPKEHGIIRGVLGKNGLNFDFLPLCKRKFVTRDIEIESSFSFNKILDLIKFSGDTVSNIRDYVRVRLNGTVNTDISIEEVKNEARQFFYYIEIEENFTYKNMDEDKYEDNDFNIIQSYKLQFENHSNKLEQQAFELGLKVLRKEKVVK